MRGWGWWCLVVIMVVLSLGFENSGFRQKNATLKVYCYSLSTSSYWHIAWTDVNFKHLMIVFFLLLQLQKSCQSAACYHICPRCP